MPRESFLTELCRAGKPLIELTASLTLGQSLEVVVRAFNALGPDIEATPSPYASVLRTSTPPETQLLSIDATREALERLFGWRFARVPAATFVPAAVGRSDPPQGFRWREVCPLQYFPPSLDGRIESIGIFDPGANDDGQDDVITYEIDGAAPKIIGLRSDVYDLWRQDDNGRRFWIRTFASQSEANAAMREFESHGHRQTYSVERRRPS